MSLVRRRLSVLVLSMVIAVFALSSLAAGSANAQSGYPTTNDPRLEYVPPERSLEELQREYDSIRLWAPAVGIPVSYLTVGGGMALIVGANFDLCFYESCVDEPLTRGERAATAVGAIIIVAGVAGFVTSIVRIRQKKEKKRRLEWEMGRLRFGG